MDHDKLKAKSEKELKFILERCEKLLNETVVESTVLMGRLNTLVTIVFSLLTASVAYATGNLFTHPEAATSAFIGALYLIYPCYLLYENIKGKPYHSLGRSATTYQDDYYHPADTDLKDELPKCYYVGEISNVQHHIDANKSLNGERWKQFHLALKLLLLSPIVYFGVFILLSFFRNVAVISASCN